MKAYVCPHDRERNSDPLSILGTDAADAIGNGTIRRIPMQKIEKRHAWIVGSVILVQAFLEIDEPARRQPRHQWLMGIAVIGGDR